MMAFLLVSSVGQLLLASCIGTKACGRSSWLAKSFWDVASAQMLAMHPGHIVEEGLKDRRQASLATAFEISVAINCLANEFLSCYLAEVARRRNYNDWRPVSGWCFGNFSS